MSRKKRKKKNKHRKLIFLVKLSLLFTTILLGYNLFKVNILGIYTYILLVGLVIVDFILVYILDRKVAFFLKIPFLLVAIAVAAASGYASYNLDRTSDFFKKIASSAGLREETFIIYASKKSSIKELNDLDGTVSVYDNGSNLVPKLNKKLKSSIDVKTKYYDDIERLLNSGLNRTSSAIVISKSYSELLHENYKELYEQYKKIDEICVITREKIKKGDVDVTKKPFIVYLSGIDTYGDIASVSRSDVNILAVVNPKTHKVLLVNTPRDYYVKLSSYGEYDKLTHAGIYGVSESIKTLEDLYNIKIPFYVKVNFSSIIKLVDTLDGITVDSNYEFSYDGYSFTKGENTLDGKKALAFSRYRKGLPQGDISRGENQEAVIKGIIEKVTSPSIIKNYSSLLSSVSDGIVTNMQDNDFYKLAKYQINNKPKWTIETKNATGFGDYRTTYSAGGTELYVMTQDEDSVNDIKKEINKCLGKKEKKKVH